MAKVQFHLQDYTELLTDIIAVLSQAQYTTTNSHNLRAAGGAWAARGLLESAQKAVIRSASKALKNPQLSAPFLLSTAEAIAVAAFVRPFYEGTIADYCHMQVGHMVQEELEPQASFPHGLVDNSAPFYADAVR
ncbi:hypothetical protein [Rhodoflexus caldus]|uniref:hypothetical protein n=1 Tax=Rhodoflexus caldus TaxID=2891236 RepID=UPI00202ABDD9|nr:hypothetical protein [Rhodoflexus caldus]